MYQFTGTLKNELRPEPGVNITVKGLEEDRVILAPTGPWYTLDKKQDGNTLELTLAPSSGTTDKRSVKVEIANGTEETNTSPNQWEVKLTASSESKPAEVDLVITFEEEFGEE